MSEIIKTGLRRNLVMAAGEVIRRSHSQELSRRGDDFPRLLTELLYRNPSMAEQIWEIIDKKIDYILNLPAKQQNLWLSHPEAIEYNGENNIFTLVISTAV